MWVAIIILWKRVNEYIIMHVIYMTQIYAFGIGMISIRYTDNGCSNITTSCIRNTSMSVVH